MKPKILIIAPHSKCQTVKRDCDLRAKEISENMEKIGYLLEVIKKEYKYGIIISHIESIKGIQAKQIKVGTENNYSKIIA